MPVELRVYDDDLSTLLGGGPVADVYQVEWMRERWDPGSGSFVVPSDSATLDAHPTLFDNDVVVEVRQDGVPLFLFLTERFRRSRGDVWDAIRFAGPGAIDLFRRMLVYPLNGIGAQPLSDQRIWSWSSPEYPDSEWGPVGGSSVGAPLSTPGFPDDQAVGYEPIFPGERTLYRRLLGGAAAPVPARMALAATWNTEVVVYIDSIEVLRKEAGTRGVFTVDIEYPDYDVTVGVEVKGKSGSFGAGRWGWSWMELVGVDVEDAEPTYGTALRRTYDPADFPSATPWLSFEGDQPYPGVTPGLILKRLFDEGQARGVLGGVTIDFDEDVDSAGTSWPRTNLAANGPGMVEMTASVFDDSWLSVAERLADLGVEVELGPDRVLHAWQGRGEDLSATVDVTGYASSVSAQGERDRRNVLVARTARSFIERTVGSGPRREAFVALGGIPSDEGATRISDDLVARLAEPLDVFVFQLDPAGADPVPGADFGLGDTVTGWRVDGPAGLWTAGPVVVESFRWALTAAGVPTFVVEVVRPVVGEVAPS